jgi:hypothetical protein
MADGVAQGVGPEFNPQYCWKKKKKSKIQLLTEQKIIGIAIKVR